MIVNADIGVGVDGFGAQFKHLRGVAGVGETQRLCSFYVFCAAKKKLVFFVSFSFPRYTSV